MVQFRVANQVHKARLLAASSPHTGHWIQAMPSPSLGLHMDKSCGSSQAGDEDLWTSQMQLRSDGGPTGTPWAIL